MKFSMIGQENGDLLIQVTAWVDSTVQQITIRFCIPNSRTELF